MTCHIIFNLNKEKLVDINKILKVNEKHLAKLIKPSGYYNQKAKKLKIIAKFLSKTKINQLKTKELREILLKVKGIGPETADSIILYAFEFPSFVIDAYTKRIFSRLGIVKNEKINYDEIKDLFESKLKNEKNKVKLFKEYHALIVEHAKNFCRKKPLCKNCILKNICNYS